MDRKNQIILNIKGLHCANCAAKIERKINEINYVKEAHIDFMGEKILLETEETNKNVLVSAIQKIANSIEEGVRIFSTEKPNFNNSHNNSHSHNHHHSHSHNNSHEHSHSDDTKKLLIMLGTGVIVYILASCSSLIIKNFNLDTSILLTIKILLFLIIVKGIFFTNLAVKPDIYPHAFKRGFLEGYQTMDTIASIAYAGIILKAIKSGRNLTHKQEFSFLIKSGLVAIISLALIYGGFALVGAKMHSVLATDDKIELLVKTTSYLLGNYGIFVLAICVAGACLTTAIGLVATVGEFFSSITSFKYENIVIFTVIISFLLSILGVESIINISIPILVFIYPVMISLILLNLFGKFVKNDYVYKGVVLFTGIIGLIESLEALGIKNYYTKSVLEILPFSDYGLTWLFPGIIGYILFSLMFRKAKMIENKL